MIIMVTGATHTGKTLMTKRMLRKCSYALISMDTLKMGLIRSNNTDLTPMDDDLLTEYLWPIVKEMIKTSVENEQDMIVEGCYVPFEWRKELEEKYTSQVKFVCLAMTDEFIDKHFEDIKKHSTVAEKRLDDDITVEGLKADNKKVIEGFKASGEEVTLIEDDYEKTIDDILRSLDLLEERTPGDSNY